MRPAHRYLNQPSNDVCLRLAPFEYLDVVWCYRRGWRAYVRGARLAQLFPTRRLAKKAAKKAAKRRPRVQADGGKISPA
jgi:hypothetical protein